MTSTSGFGNSPPRGRRAVPRTQAPLKVEVSSGGEKHSAILRDISRTGAKLGGVSPLAEGQEVELKSGEMRVMGQVVWIEGGDCAIAFDFPIAAVEVSRLQSLAKFVEGVSDKKL